MAAARLLLVLFKNAVSSYARPFSSSAALIQQPWTRVTDETEVSDGESAVYKRALKLQRPTTIKYEDRLHNSVSLIGAIDRPLRECNCSRFGVHTTLINNSPRGAYRSLNIMLKFWDEMAEMSVQHLKPNDLVFVSGCLGWYVKVNENGESEHRYEV